MKILFFLILISALCQAQDLQTVAEKSNWTKTGNAQEVTHLCRSFQKRFPQRVKCKIFGKTPQGRDMHYLFVGDSKNPVVWVQAGIHAGEIDGKDATFWLLKDILEGKIRPDPLSKISMVFIPVFNLDGHERMGRWNRPNQIGPEEMGWRTTSQNLNLNRDFMKASAPEMRALLKLWHSVDPVVSLDLHVTNGAQFRPEVGIIVHPQDEFGKSLEIPLIEKLKSWNHLALPFYPSFEKHDRPESGFSRYVSTGRYSQGYWFNNNRLGVLVETHSWKDYKTRVRTHRSTVLATLEIAKLKAVDWRKSERKLDVEELASREVDLEFKHTDKFTLIDFPGYKYTRKKSEISGSEVIVYDPHTPQNWRVPFYDELTPSLTIRAPAKGYFIQPQDDWLISKLEVHNIQYRKCHRDHPKEVEVFRAASKEFSTHSFEGQQMLKVKGHWKMEQITLPKNCIFVSINQAKARLILSLLEPLATDSFLSWGFFNQYFEPKEYMEHYVAEEVAIGMLKNPEIKSEFEEKLKTDSAFKGDSEARINFFYSKHPSWDSQLDRYPVFRL